MIAISDLSYYVGGRALYEDASLHIKPQDKIGLIGLNGTGKTTLLRLINEDYKPDKGSISKSKDCSIGFLNQDLLSYQTDDSILSVAMEAFSEVVEIQKQLDKIIHKLETEYSDKLVERLSVLQENFDRLDGYTAQAKAEEILEGIGFSTEDLHRPLKEFSGGWRMRVMLAKLLLEKPSLLMLDEPTNHLDLPSIEWVENYLRNYEGAVIVVSHDRKFLDNITTKIVEVDQQQMIPYEGNYSYYLEEKELRNEIRKNAFKNQQQKIKQTEKFIQRFRAKATKSRQVQSKVKSLEKMDKVEDVVESSSSIKFRFTMKQKSGRHILHLENISQGYKDVELFKNTSALIERGDKIALIGANGKGKSTLLRIIDGSQKIQGKRREGHNVIKGFFAQHQLESLHVENEILEELKQAGSGKNELELRSVLGCFLFTDDDVFKKIKVLSGGEKSRVALAKTLISEANFLLLDEPTNHLDFISENILIQALQQYEGSYVVVSHNRHFITQTANKIWYIEDKEIKEYPGTYEEYLYWKNSIKTDDTPPPPPKKTNAKEKQVKNNDEADLNQEIKKKIKVLEEQILEQEGKKEETEKELNSNPSPEELAKLLNLHQEIQQALETLNNEWEVLVEQLE